MQRKDREFFTACLYTCYEYIKPDLVLELSWRFGLLEFSMPYFIQIMKDLTNKVETVQKKHDEREKKEEKAAQQQISTPLDFANDLGIMMPQMGGMAMLMPPPGSMPPFQDYGGNGMVMGGMPGMNPFGNNGPNMGGFGNNGPNMGGFGNNVPNMSGFGNNVPNMDGFGNNFRN